MDKIKPSISAAQMFCLLMMSRIAAEVVYPRSVSSSAADALGGILLAEIIRFILALPLIIYSFKGANIHRAVYNKNKFLGWTGAVIAALMLIAAAFRTLFNTAEFAVKNLLTGGSMWVILAVAAIFAVYAASMDVEANARAGAIFLITAAIVTVTVILADIPYMKPSALGNGTVPSEQNALFQTILERILRGGDYLIFSALLPYVNIHKKGGRGAAVIWFAIISAAASLLICLSNGMVLRELYGECEYPLIAAASLSDISLFKRLDGFTAALWSLCAVFRAGLMLLSAVRVIVEVSPAFECKVTKQEGEA